MSFVHLPPGQVTLLWPAKGDCVVLAPASGVQVPPRLSAVQARYARVPLFSMIIRYLLLPLTEYTWMHSKMTAVLGFWSMMREAFVKVPGKFAMGIDAR